jgi:voltage-gated potassium channel Kch
VAGGGWADLAATVPLLRIFRLIRCVRVARLLRRKGSRRFIAEVNASRALSTFLLTIFLVMVVVELAGATIFYVEQGAEGSNIASAGDAIWWGLVTITSVGYGDRYPVTGWGRIIGVLLLFAGIGLFSVLTGFIANAFIAPRGRPRLAPHPDDPRATILAVRDLLAEQDRRTEAIRWRLDELERLVSQVAGSEQPGTAAPGPGSREPAGTETGNGRIDGDPSARSRAPVGSPQAEAPASPVPDEVAAGARPQDQSRDPTSAGRG